MKSNPGKFIPGFGSSVVKVASPNRQRARFLPGNGVAVLAGDRIMPAILPPMFPSVAGLPKPTINEVLAHDAVFMTTR